MQRYFQNQRDKISKYPKSVRFWYWANSATGALWVISLVFWLVGLKGLETFASGLFDLSTFLFLVSFFGSVIFRVKHK